MPTLFLWKVLVICFKAHKYSWLVGANIWENREFKRGWLKIFPTRIKCRVTEILTSTFIMSYNPSNICNIWYSVYCGQTRRIQWEGTTVKYFWINDQLPVSLFEQEWANAECWTEGISLLRNKSIYLEATDKSLFIGRHKMFKYWLKKIFFSLMWTIFKVFIEFVTILLLLFFYILAFWSWGIWDLSSRLGIKLPAPALEEEVSSTGPPGKSLMLYF